MNLLINLKIERIRAGMTQSDLAKKVGINTFMVARIESGQTVPRVDTLKKISEVLNVTMEDLMGGECRGRST